MGIFLFTFSESSKKNSSKDFKVEAFPFKPGDAERLAMSRALDPWPSGQPRFFLETQIPPKFVDEIEDSVPSTSGCEIRFFSLNTNGALGKTVECLSDMIDMYIKRLSLMIRNE